MVTVTTAKELPTKGVLVIEIDLKNGTSIVVNQDLQKEDKSRMFQQLLPNFENFVMIYDTELDNIYLIPFVEIEYIEVWINDE